jgi:hypothetical protein
VAQIAADRETRTSLSRSLPMRADAASIEASRSRLQIVDENLVR